MCLLFEPKYFFKMASFLARVSQMSRKLGLSARCYRQLPQIGALTALHMQPIQTRNVYTYSSHGGWLGARASELSVSKPLPQSSAGCPICSRNITFTYKDVLFLSQFLSPEGYLLNRRITGLKILRVWTTLQAEISLITTKNETTTFRLILHGDIYERFLLTGCLQETTKETGEIC